MDMRPANPEAPAPPRSKAPEPPGRAWPLPAVVLVIGLLVSVAAALQVGAMVERQDRDRFAAAVGEAQFAIRTRLQAYLAVLRAADGLVAAGDGRVTRAEFRAFAEQLHLSRVYPGIQGLGYSARMPGLDGPATEALLRSLGAQDVRIYPDDPREEVHAIVHLDPMDRRNQVALGYDMFSHPVRRAAMERARDTGRSAMSGKVQLVQEIDPQKQAGFLIYRPVYDGGPTPPTVAERRARLLGFVYAPFRAGDLLEGIFGAKEAARLDFAVYDGELAPENLLHTSFALSPREAAERAEHSAVRELVLAGRRWIVTYHSTATFEAQSNRWLAFAFLAGGLAATLLVALATWRLAWARLAAEAEIAARRAGEQQRRLLIAELNHRVKNTLATVQSIAAQALREGKSLRDTRDSFEARLLALSQTHNLLTRDSWQGAELHELVQLELAPYRGAGEGRVRIQGEPVYLPADMALALGMALHELATNAAKYGAFSTPEGGLRLEWSVTGEAGARRLRLEWREEGGPPVAEPATRGFGMRLIGTGLRRQLGGEVDILFELAGLRCVMDLPLRDGEPPPLWEPAGRAEGG